MEAYAAAQARSAADPADVLETLADRINTDPDVRAYAAGPRYFIDGFSDFTELEKGVLLALIRAGAELTVCLTCGETEESELFALTAGTARWLEAAAGEAGQPCVRSSRRGR